MLANRRSFWLVCAVMFPGVVALASDDHVIATVGSEKITEAQVRDQAKDEFEKLRADQELRVHQLQVKQEQDRYALLKEQTDKILDAKALALESQHRHKPEEALLAEIKVSSVTDTEVSNFYEANKARTNKTLDQLKPEITQYLALQHNTDAKHHFYEDLRAKYHVASLLEPYRMTVDPTGPARGNEHAAVTVVEFGDFQCPYCRQAEDTLQSVLSKHPQDVRVVFRELPLGSIHPNALGAAKAAVCADRQGKFWAMHDAMYSNQNSLDDAGLKETAKRVGLDSDQFNSCVADHATTEVIFTDVKAADELNITGTPFFLVNGRPINGVVSADQFEQVVNEELRRSASNHG